MIPITWPELANIHPFAPQDQVQGYQEMFKVRRRGASHCPLPAGHAVSPLLCGHPAHEPARLRLWCEHCEGAWHVAGWRQPMAGSLCVPLVLPVLLLHVLSTTLVWSLFSPCCPAGPGAAAGHHHRV